MGEVAVHLEHELGAVGQSTPEPGDVRRPDPLLGCAVEHRDPRQLPGQSVGDLAGPVGRSVVDHEHAVARGVQDVAERPHHRLEVLALVVRREADDGARHVPIIAAWPRRCPGTRSSPTSSTSSRTSRRSSARSRSRSSPTAERPPGSGRRRAPSPSSRSPGVRRAARHRQDDRGEGRRGRRAGRDAGPHERRERVPEGVVDFLRLPGRGPKTAARIWTQLGVTTLDALQARPRRSPT